MTKLAVLNVVGLTRALIGEHTPHIQKFLDSSWSIRLEEPFPAVTCTSQSNMLTGEGPTVHGIVGNGWYFKDLAEVGFWKQNDGLVRGKKVWEELKENNSEFTCAKIFWWYNMYSSVNWSITPRPQYPADGRKIFGVYTHPFEMADEIVSDLGKFPFMNFWGPASDIPSSRWIANCAMWIFKKHQPDLNLVYLPHLDYCLQKWGTDPQVIKEDLKKIDEVVGSLLDFYKGSNVNVLIVSEYGVTPVNNVIHPNRILRKAGYLKVIPSLSWELIDAGASRAFAVSDHQICHIYVKENKDTPEIVKLFEKEPGQKKIIFGNQKIDFDLDHERAGDIILMAQPDFWYTYYYWTDNDKAPDFARCVDIHRKPGFDPVEMFLDPAIKFPKLKIAFKLFKKMMGFRMMMDVIPLTPELVKGSHGTPVQNPDQGPIAISNYPSANPRKNSLPMAEVKNIILNHYKI